jgi:hypothetical protein
LEENEVWELKLDFGKFNSLNQELDCEKIKVWRSFKTKNQPVSGVQFQG